MNSYIPFLLDLRHNWRFILQITEHLTEALLPVTGVRFSAKGISISMFLPRPVFDLERKRLEVIYPTG